MNSPKPSAFIDRRTLLRGFGVVLALPWLESLRGSEPGGPGTGQPRRMINVTHKFGMYAPTFHPATAGAGWEMTDGLRPLERHARA